jgi:hypothetical protein
MRVLSPLSVIAILPVLSCAMLTAGDARPRVRLRSVEGLERVEAPLLRYAAEHLVPSPREGITQ